MWLSHHYADDYDRCVVIGRRHVCRRCLVLYPVAAMALILALAGVRWSKSLDLVLLVALPIPGVAEFVLEHLGVIRYRPVLQGLVTVPLGVALGVGFDRYLHHYADPLFWGMVVLYGAICLASVLSSGAGVRRNRAGHIHLDSVPGLVSRSTYQLRGRQPRGWATRLSPPAEFGAPPPGGHIQCSGSRRRSRTPTHRPRPRTWPIASPGPRPALGSRLVILGHHYQREEVMRWADARGDSFGLSRLAADNHQAEYVVFCGVHFMAESADILTGAATSR